MSAPIIALHGFGGTPEDWDPVLRRIGGARSCLCPSLPGHGPSPPPSHFADAVDQLARVLPSVRCFVVGYSLGARLGLGLLARHPERVAGLAVVGGNVGLIDPGAREERRSLDAARAAQLRAAPAEFWPAWDALPLLATPPSPAVEARRRRRERHRSGPLAQTLEALSTGAMPDLRPVVSAPRRPLLLVAGERDTTYREAYQALTHEHAPLRLVAGAGHRVLVEAPGALGTILLDWLSAVDTSS